MTVMAAAPWPLRVVQSHGRTGAAVLLGLLAYLLAPRSLLPGAGAVLAWDIGAVAFLAVATHLFLGGRDDSRMIRNAAAQAEGEWVIFSITLAGVVFSFVALTMVFSGIKGLPAEARSLYVALVAATLLLSWLVTHVLFALRYAHEYYATDAAPGPGIDGGLEFPGQQPPDYWDFCYFSLVLGMTFQVSDVQITSRKLRRLALVHGLIGFLFNTVIVALTVNIAASLL